MKCQEERKICDKVKKIHNQIKQGRRRMEKYFSKVVSLNLPVHTVVNQFHYKQ